MSLSKPEAVPQPQKPVLTLRPYQIEHYRRIMAILQKFYFFVDGSEMGRGKTFVAAAVALTMGVPVIVICPKTARATWVKVLTDYSVSVYNLPDTGGIITYESLRSTKNNQPKHGLLVREDGVEGVNFYATTTLAQIVKAGVLVIFDEFQKLKNNSDQHKAAKALLKQFYTQGGNSRFALLSGSAMDKEEHATNFLKLVGFIESRNLYSKIRGEIRLDGIQELYGWARKIDPAGTDRYIAENPFRGTRNDAISYVFGLFTQVIKPGIMSTMPNAEYNGEKDVKNGYYVLDPDNEVAYRKACSDLAHSVRYNAAQGTVTMTKENMGAVTTALVNLQAAKQSTMARVGLEDLNKTFPTPSGEQRYCKLILFADYYDTIDYLKEAFRQYNPVELTGRTSEAKRAEAVAAFQAPDYNCRVLIGNPLVGGLSVSLHDTTGLFPRVMYIMPNYRINECHQATGRIFRDGVVGRAKIRFFYGLSGSRENSVLNAIARKGQVMKEVHSEQGAKFPNEYEDEYEAEPPAGSPELEPLVQEPDDVEVMIRDAMARVTGTLTF